MNEAFFSIKQGARSSDAAGGEFSVGAATVWEIKSGIMEQATGRIMLAVNIFQLFTEISKWLDNGKPGPLATPWMPVENVKVTGKQIT